LLPEPRLFRVGGDMSALLSAAQALVLRAPRGLGKRAATAAAKRAATADAPAAALTLAMRWTSFDTSFDARALALKASLYILSR